MRWATIEPAEQRGHRRALVGEDPDVALRAAERKRPGDGCDRAGFIAGGRQGQRPQRTDLDQATGPVLGDRRGVQPVQQCQRLPGPVLGQQDPGQHQVAGFSGIVWLVVRAKAVLLGKAGCGEQVALGQQQPGPLRGNRVDHARRAW